ncbi:MAG: nucleotide exchange factor GrpE [Rickettsiales bacterium]|jgi:molecular chaperone GrpE|nr:nucleotide exchange factor GrpE [Rickettsiales bacterium]
MSKHKKEHRGNNGPAKAPESCAVENDEIRRLRAELDDWKDRFLRSLAECENEKRRTMLDARNLVDSRVAEFALAMLPLADNLKIALDSIRGKADEGVLEGLEAIARQFGDALAKSGIERIKTVGEKLDPSLHQAVAQEDSPLPSGTVVRELAAGYCLNGRAIREAMVATAK